MNLRITPNFNTQNNRQNPNFKMRLVEPAVAKHIMSAMGEKTLKDALWLVRPVQDLAGSLKSGVDPLNKRAIAEYMPLHPNVYYTSSDVVEIQKDSCPYVTANQLAQRAIRITEREVKIALSDEMICKIDRQITTKQPSAETRNSAEYKQHLKRLALWDLFGIRCL